MIQCYVCCRGHFHRRQQWFVRFIHSLLSPLPPPGSDQGAVRQWLLGAGIPPLQRFVRQHGIDPGNWEYIEPVPVNNYVDGLIRIYPFEDREELLYGPIQDILGEMVVDLIEWQGHMRPEYWEHPSD